MNWLDIILIIGIALLFLGAIGLTFEAIHEQEAGIVGGVFLTWLVLTSICILPFLVIDKASGTTIGTITAVDRNFFGTHAIYIKTSETEQEKYCTESMDITKIAVNNIGKKVKVSYGTRVGLYSTGACSESPINKIEIIEE
jgi:hypothetical protein